ncbi:pirin family protein [Radicibacter daui]|uniref:pirin family protein n=1 Tax=Radicibacter daui TaxID=3064829 RepID=UPI004046EF3C
MSWHPSLDPIAGDKQSCDALELVIVPRTSDIGGMEVKRALPNVKRRMVGPFIFLDQMGPVQYIAGSGMDVRPHPHIGLSTVTYLFDGRITHRDSEGNIQDITPGAMNLMTAGRGIAHSERTPDMQRRDGQVMFGLQSWVAMPKTQEEGDPGFQHYAADTLPFTEDGGLWARVVAGKAFGLTSPVGTLSDWFYAEVRLQEGASAPLDSDYEERAIYVCAGSVEIRGDRFGPSQLLIFRPGDRITVTAVDGPARLMLLGGAVADGPRYIWWNFVSSSKERIEQAKEDWKMGRFGPVPDETEFIPLPEM